MHSRNFTLLKETAKNTNIFSIYLALRLICLFYLLTNLFLINCLYVVGTHKSGSGIRFCCGFCLHILNELHVF